MLQIFRKQGSRLGFTLIELLVVIAIIGVLASIVLASLNNARRKSRDARRITDIKQLQLALELYFDSQSPTQAYPAGTASAPTATSCDTANYGLLATQYIPAIPKDPSTGICYSYATPAAGGLTTYHLGTILEDAGNPALGGDRDCNDGASAAAPVCPTGSGATGGFTGSGAAANGDDATTPVFDVTP